MRQFRALALLTWAILLIGTMSAAQTAREARLFVFGNSLFHHLDESGRSNVAYWLTRLADEGGNDLTLDGRWGFVRDFLRDLPPPSGWSFDGVEKAMGRGIGFRRAGFTDVLIVPANFIQNVPPDRAYGGDNPTGDSPLSATGRLVDWVEGNARGARIHIYEGWALMNGHASFPPNRRGLRRYHAFNTGEYHDWFEEYVAMLNAEGRDVNLIPVATALSRVLSETPLAELDGTIFYIDEAPHGTPELYYLAALVTYAAIYGAPPPLAPELEATLHPALGGNAEAIRRIVWETVAGVPYPEEARVTLPATGLDNPSLAMGLAGISDWSTQRPFLDLMKTARPWTGHLSGQWGGVSFDDLMAAGHLSPEGWPVSLPEEVEAIEAFVLTDQHPADTTLIGRYRVTWEGQGELTLGGLAQNVERHPNGGLAFDYRPGPGVVGLRIASVDPADPIRNIAVFREADAPLIEAGAVFAPDFVARIADLRTLRFMDWMDTNGSEQQTWADRPRTTDFTYGWRGVPVEVMLRLANQVGAEPWFTLPHMADDDYVRRFATLVAEGLDPGLIVWAEWSNEAWNFIFPQARWAADQAMARWQAGDDAWIQFAGHRAAEVADIWRDAFAARPEALRTVISVHTGWPGLEVAQLEAPLRQAEGLPPPHLSFDAYAVTGYFGADMSGEDAPRALRRWIDDDDGHARLARAIRGGSFEALTDDAWPHHAGAARRYGLDLMMYEGGTHVVGHGADVEDAELTAFFTGFNYSSEIAALYDDLLTRWTEVGGTRFNAFVDVAPASKWGSWGAWRYPGDVNPRAAMLMAHASLPGPGASDAFLHGAYRDGGEGGDRIEGTSEDDLLIGRGGDDSFLPMGGADLIHGGPGDDVVVLAGAAPDWAIAWEGGAAILTGPEGPHRLTSIEVLEFAGDGTRQPLSPEGGG